MLAAVNMSEELITARILEFLDWRTLWNRALWNPGLVLMLREVLEASEAVHDKVLGNDALNLAATSGIKIAASDPGVGERTTLKALQECLRPNLRFKSLDYESLEQLTNAINAHYLSSWATYLGVAGVTPSVELTARAIAAHLLDLGFSSDYLHRWWTYKTAYEAAPFTLSEIVQHAHELAQQGSHDFEVLVAFDQITPERYGRPDGWLDPEGVGRWLDDHRFDRTHIRQDGGVVIRISARDGGAAVDAAVEAIQGLSARARIATGKELRHLPLVWVAGKTHPYKLRDGNRGVNVRALVRENVVYRRSVNKDGVDAAFEMLAPLQRGSPTTAVAAGWAAIESLLSEPDDRGSAADRLATLIACSFPRAELTQLSYSLERSDAEVAGLLRGREDNRTRCSVIANRLLSGAPVVSDDRGDDAALNRVRKLLKNPAQSLQDIQWLASLAFRRIYRQRNLVLHGGKTEAIALRACLRTSAPLVGAGMDRVAHGYYVQGMLPLVTAAKARIGLTTVASRGPLAALDLLA